jgi:hypothetical protein
MRRCKWKSHNLFYFWIVVKWPMQCSDRSLFFLYSRGYIRVAMIAGETQAMTDVSEMAQKLMTACEGAMTIINCVDTESEAHETANAAFDVAASQLEELGYFLHEMTSDGVVFSRAETAKEEYDPEARIAAAAFLGLSATAALGSLDQVIGAGAYKSSSQRCPAGSSLLEEQREGCKEPLLQALRKSAQVSRECAALLLLRGAQVYLKELPQRSRGGQGIRLENGRGRL